MGELCCGRARPAGRGGEPPSPRLGSGRLRLQSWPCWLPTCCADLGRFLAVSDPRPWSEVRYQISPSPAQAPCVARGVCHAWDTAVAAGVPACPLCPAAHRGSNSNLLAERWKDRPRSSTPAQRRRAAEAAGPLPRALPAPWPLRARTTLTPVLMLSRALSSRLSEQLGTS